MIELHKLRELDLQTPAQHGRPAHLSAASGLQQIAERLYVVADDEQHLGVFPATGLAAGTLLQLFPGDLPLDPATRKAHKKDLEVLCRLPPFAGYLHGALLALGSGSRGNRCAGALLRLDATGFIVASRLLDWSALYHRIGIHVAELNIEGAVVSGGQLILLQRGNRGVGRNALVRLPLPAMLDDLTRPSPHTAGSVAIRVQDLDLGVDAAGVAFGLTDADVLPDGRLLFSAVSEDTQDSYRDGPCGAAAVGILGVDGALQLLETLTPAHKIEGVSAQVLHDRIDLLLVSDADDPAIAAGLFRAQLRLPR